MSVTNEGTRASEGGFGVRGEFDEEGGDEGGMNEVKIDRGSE